MSNKGGNCIVYKEKSFSKAAQKLFIAQPSLSATVKRLESKLISDGLVSDKAETVETAVVAETSDLIAEM